MSWVGSPSSFVLSGSGCRVGDVIRISAEFLKRISLGIGLGLTSGLKDPNALEA